MHWKSKQPVLLCCDRSWMLYRLPKIPVRRARRCCRNHFLGPAGGSYLAGFGQLGDIGGERPSEVIAIIVRECLSKHAITTFPSILCRG